MPKGFNRLGKQEKLKIHIFDAFEDNYDNWNVPSWKYKNKEGHTFVRGLRPRKNEAFLHIFLEDCMEQIDCFEITEKEIKFMD